MRLNRKTQAICTAALALSLVVTQASFGIGGMGKGKGQGQRMGGPASQIQTLPVQELSADEKKGLLLMREEEKLARDVYMALYKQWRLPIFSNIAASEQRHMDAIRTLLDRYGLKDPIAGLQPGVFGDPKMADLYKELVAKGLGSLENGLHVGATIEDLDIKDLYELLEETDNKDIQTIYTNLARGSRNHLRAFVSQLEPYDIQYKAQYLNQQTVNTIIGSPKERGNGAMRNQAQRFQACNKKQYGKRGSGCFRCASQQKNRKNCPNS